MGISQAVAHRVLMSQPSSLIQTSCLIDDQRDTVQIVCDNLTSHPWLTMEITRRVGLAPHPLRLSMSS
jgi:hypothetical protein